MRRGVVLLVFVAMVFVVGCRFDLPEVGIDAEPTVGCRNAKYAPLSGGNPGHVYLRATEVKLWHTANDVCVDTGPRAYLAVPNNAAELTSLKALVDSHQGPWSQFWVGIHDRPPGAEDAFVTLPMDTPATFLPWNTSGGEPDNVGEQDCVAATATTISTEACDVAARPYICECEP